MYLFLHDSKKRGNFPALLNKKFIGSFNKINMKKIFAIIVIIIFCKTSNAQMFKSFDCLKSYEDSFVTVYSLKIRLHQQIDNDSRINIVKTELNKRFHVQSNKILQIETLGSKKYRTYQYNVRVVKN